MHMRSVPCFGPGDSYQFVLIAWLPNGVVSVDVYYCEAAINASVAEQVDKGMRHVTSGFSKDWRKDGCFTVVGGHILMPKQAVVYERHGASA